MDQLNDCVDRAHSRWLASSISCCFPRRPVQPDLNSQALEKPRDICYEQPRAIAPLQLADTHDPSSTHYQRRSSQWVTEGRRLASKASNRASILTRRSTSHRRPTIGAPTDFKRIEFPTRRPSRRERGFRPLELSIYVPGNELSPLPDFTEEWDEDTDAVEYPQQALVKSRSDTMLSRTSTFSIPRKPVPSRSASMELSRISMDSHYTFSDTTLGTGTRSAPRRPSIAASQSTQDFLDMLDARLPQSPPLVKAKPGPEPVFTVYRRASEQSVRLRNHLEERQQVECDTILEEKPFDLEPQVTMLSPISSHGSDTLADLDEHRTSYQHSPQSSVSSNGSSKPIDKRLPPPRTSSIPHPSTLGVVNVDPSAKLEPAPDSSAARSRISQWLIRTLSSFSTEKPSAGPKRDFYSCQAPPIPDRTSIDSSLWNTSNPPDYNAAWPTSRISPQRQRSSLSFGRTRVPGQCLSIDIKDHPAVVDVGVAF